MCSVRPDKGQHQQHPSSSKSAAASVQQLDRSSTAAMPHTTLSRQNLTGSDPALTPFGRSKLYACYITHVCMPFAAWSVFQQLACRAAWQDAVIFLFMFLTSPTNAYQVQPVMPRDTHMPCDPSSSSLACHFSVEQGKTETCKPFPCTSPSPFITSHCYCHTQHVMRFRQTHSLAHQHVRALARSLGHFQGPTEVYGLRLPSQSISCYAAQDCVWFGVDDVNRFASCNFPQPSSKSAVATTRSIL